jgi:hypothetical protein
MNELTADQRSALTEAIEALQFAVIRLETVPREMPRVFDLYGGLAELHTRNGDLESAEYATLCAQDVGNLFAKEISEDLAARVMQNKKLTEQLNNKQSQEN